MGIYDREYYRGDGGPRGFSLGGGPRMIVTNVVIVTAVIYFISLFTPVTPDGKSHLLNDILSMSSDMYRRPWVVWKLLTYGFAHAGIWHLGLNMLILWMFGRVIESRLGRTEFLAFYLMAIIFSGLAWLGLENAWLHGTDGGQDVLNRFGSVSVVGASGGVTAVFIMFVLYYPRETVYIWGLLPVPAWVIGAFIIGSDLVSGIRGTAGNTAWQAHLGGAAFAFLYLQFRWNLSRLLPAPGKWKLPSRGPRLRIHDPDQSDAALDEEADRILAKVHREGEQGLTGRERRILERYSRRMRERRR